MNYCLNFSQMMSSSLQKCRKGWDADMGMMRPAVACADFFEIIMPDGRQVLFLMRLFLRPWQRAYCCV